MTAGRRVQDALEDLNSANLAIKRSAVFEVARSQATHAASRLKEIAASDPSMELRYLARKALNYLKADCSEDPATSSGPEAATRASPDPHQIIQALTHEDPQQRARALKAAARLKDKGLLPAILERVGQENHPEVRSLLPPIIGLLGGRNQIYAVAGFLSDPDPRVKSNAIEALERIGDVSAYAVIIKTLQDPDHRVLATAIRALGRLGKSKVIRCCELMLQSPEYWLRDAAAYCLSSSAYPEAIPLLEAALGDEYEAVRIKGKKGLEKLAELGYEPARKALHKASPIKRFETLDDFLRLEAMSSPDSLTRTVPITGDMHRKTPLGLKVMEVLGRNPESPVTGRIGIEHEARPAAQTPTPAWTPPTTAAEPGGETTPAIPNSVVAAPQATETSPLIRRTQNASRKTGQRSQTSTSACASTSASAGTGTGTGTGTSLPASRPTAIRVPSASVLGGIAVAGPLAMALVGVLFFIRPDQDKGTGSTPAPQSRPSSQGRTDPGAPKPTLYAAILPPAFATLHLPTTVDEVRALAPAGTFEEVKSLDPGGAIGGESSTWIAAKLNVPDLKNLWFLDLDLESIGGSKRSSCLRFILEDQHVVGFYRSWTFCLPEENQALVEHGRVIAQAFKSQGQLKTHESHLMGGKLAVHELDYRQGPLQLKAVQIPEATWFRNPGNADKSCRLPVQWQTLLLCR